MCTCTCIPQVVSWFQKAKHVLVPENVSCGEDMSDEILGEIFYL